MERIIVTVDADLEDLIPGFLENRYRDIRALKEKLEYNDYQSIAITGHSMKGFGAGYGFDEISKIGAELEQAAKQGQSLEVAKKITEFEDYMGKIEIRFE
ncbi:Hpt domain-containing protein [Desulfuribacillus alkaliarsenatis]|uniref:Phosphotransferase n=1 Tax=Desulfuribacillus alkaliarsenatis TaxID=766136 RepID=A0A1E5G5F6_9FIRM|nr:Hpt domain-containing protein [Desulfuribacillus alkaliarsenatis]OEF98393.1 phosphotransferase [Desulfuribacillus alkaliarsenatis]